MATKEDTERELFKVLYWDERKQRCCERQCLREIGDTCRKTFTPALLSKLAEFVHDFKTGDMLAVQIKTLLKNHYDEVTELFQPGFGGILEHKLCKHALNHFFSNSKYTKKMINVALSNKGDKDYAALYDFFQNIERDGSKQADGTVFTGCSRRDTFRQFLTIYQKPFSFDRFYFFWHYNFPFLAGGTPVDSDTDSSTPTTTTLDNHHRRPKILILGAAYFDLSGHWNDDFTTCGQIQQVAMDAVGRKIMEVCDGRDWVRVRSTEYITKSKAYTVALNEKAQNYKKGQHLRADFSGRKFVEYLWHEFGRETKFRQVVLDWFHAPNTWARDRWKSAIFGKTALALADMLDGGDQEGIDDLPCAIYFPFLTHSFCKIVDSVADLCTCYVISFVYKSEAREISLYLGTEEIDGEVMIQVFQRRADQDDTQCKVDPGQIDESDCKYRKAHYISTLDKIKNCEDVRFIKLRPLKHGEQGGFHFA